MTPPLLLWPETRVDIREARGWYEKQRQGLGNEFLATVREALSRVEEAPLQFPRIRGEVRRAPLHRFPYAILYIPEAEHTVVLACFHARRNPKVWQARLVSR